MRKKLIVLFFSLFMLCMVALPMSVFAAEEAPKTKVTGITVTSSHSLNAGDEKNLVDGSYETGWIPQWGKTGMKFCYDWAKLDFGFAKKINEVVLTAPDNKLPGRLTVSYSRDGESWRVLGAEQFVPEWDAKHQVSIKFDTVLAQYVRVEVFEKGSDKNEGKLMLSELREIEVYEGKGKVALDEKFLKKADYEISANKYITGDGEQHFEMAQLALLKDGSYDRDSGDPAGLTMITSDQVTFVFDLGAEKSVKRVSIFNAGDWQKEFNVPELYPSKLSFKSSTDGVTFTDIPNAQYVDQKGMPTWNNYTFDAPVNARYIECFINSVFVIHEIEIFEEVEVPTFKEEAREKVAVSAVTSSHSLGAGDEKKIIDGDVGSGWIPQWGKTGMKFCYDWAKLDLGEAKKISSIDITSCNEKEPGMLTVSYSRDGIGWKTIGEDQFVPVWDNNKITLRFDTVLAQYVRIEIFQKGSNAKGDMCLSEIREVEIFAGEGEAPIDEKFLKDTAYTISSNKYITGDGEKTLAADKLALLNDGAYDRDSADPAGLAMIESDRNTLVFDLGSAMDVKRFAIFNAGDWQKEFNSPELYPSKISFRSSVDGVEFTDIPNAQYVDQKGMPTWNYYDFETAVNARYIECYINAVYVIHEVEIFTEVAGETDLGALQSKELIKENVKTDYYQGQPLNISGLTVKLVYDTQTVTAPVSADMIANFDTATSVVGNDQTITITFNGETFTYTINVRKAIPQVDLPSEDFLALSGSTASSMLGDGAYDGSATDGNTLDGWTARWGFAEGVIYTDEWLTVDIGSEKVVSGVVIYVGEYKRPNCYRVEYSRDGESWAEATDIIKRDVWGDANAKGEIYHYIKLDKEISARYVRIRIFQKGMDDTQEKFLISIHEVRLYEGTEAKDADAIFYKNTAIDVEKLTASGEGKENLIDGLYIQHSMDEVKPWRDTNREAWIAYDFGAKTNVGKIVLCQSSLDLFPMNFHFEVSDNGSEWIKIPDTDFVDYLPTRYINEFTFAPVKTQHIRIVMDELTGSEYAIRELMIGETNVEGAEYEPARVESIKLKSDNYKKDYKINETLDVTGMTLEVTYSDGTVKEVEVTKDMVSNFDSSKENSALTITITYIGKTTNATLKVAKASVPDTKPEVSKGCGGNLTVSSFITFAAVALMAFVVITIKKNKETK